MSKRVGVVLTIGAFALVGIAGTAAAASAGEIPAGPPVVLSHGDDSPSPSVSPSDPAAPSPSTSPSVSPSVSVSPSPSDSVSPSPSVSVSPSPSVSVSPSVTPGAPAIITADQARAIALAASGGGTFTKFELKDERSDHPEYRAEIRNGRTEHKIRINAVTGVITRHDIKS